LFSSSAVTSLNPLQKEAKELKRDSFSLKILLIFKLNKEKKKMATKMAGAAMNLAKRESSSLCGKLETDIEIKASAGKFHHMFAGRPHHVSKATPGKIQGCELHEGDWGKVGSIVFWNYVHGKCKVILTFIGKKSSNIYIEYVLKLNIFINEKSEQKCILDVNFWPRAHLSVINPWLPISLQKTFIRFLQSNPQICNDKSID